MPSNQCPRCLKEFKFPYLLKRHEERKKPCKAVILENNPKIIPNNPKIIPNNPKIIPKSSQSKSGEIFTCKHCKKNFQSKNSYYKHKNELRCKEMSDREKKKILFNKKNKVLKKKQETNQITLYGNNGNNLKNPNVSESGGSNNTNINGSNNSINSNNNIHNNVNHNVQNNITIKINPFGQENTDFLTKEEKLKIINKCYMSVPALIETIHNHPENRNFYISNKKNGVMAILNDNNETEFNDYDEICNQLIEKNMDRLDDYFSEFENELKESVKSRLQKVINFNEDDTLNDKYMTDIKYYLMNISKRNKKEINEFIDKLELQLTA